MKLLISHALAALSQGAVVLKYALPVSDTSCRVTHRLFLSLVLLFDVSFYHDPLFGILLLHTECITSAYSTDSGIPCRGYSNGLCSRFSTTVVKFGSPNKLWAKCRSLQSYGLCGMTRVLYVLMFSQVNPLKLCGVETIEPLYLQAFPEM